MSNNVKLQVLLRAVDQASRPFKSIRTASKSLSGDIRETQKSLRELNGQASRIEGFRKTSAQRASRCRGISGKHKNHCAS
ncbi:hypothetical protein AACM17_001004 [Escherichia coli]